MVSLSASIVTYAPDLPLLATVLEHLGRALDHARQRGGLGGARLMVVDNGPDRNGRESLHRVLEAAALPMTVAVLSGHGNIGYGAGHNLALQQSDADLHLILNPDVFLDADALSAGLEFLAAHPEAGLIAPAAWDQAGRRQYLCKRYPCLLYTSRCV